VELPLEEVMRLVAAVNAARGHRDAAHPASAARPADDTRESREALDALEARFHVGRVLAVYGTLAPGKPNHHVVAPLGGGAHRGRNPSEAPTRLFLIDDAREG